MWYTIITVKDRIVQQKGNDTMKVTLNIFDPNSQHTTFNHNFMLPDTMSLDDTVVIWYWVMYLRDCMDTATRITWGQYEYLEALIKTFIANGSAKFGWMTLTKEW